MNDEDIEDFSPIELNITIDPDSDETLYKRLIEISGDKRIDSVLSWIRIGEIASNLIVAQTSDKAIESYFKPVLGKMEELQNTIDTMKGDFTKSQSIGRIGEEILKNQFNNYFSTRGDIFEIVSDEPHQADIHASIQVERGDEGNESIPVLIEAKLYSYSVPDDEVEKFWEDLSRKTEFKAGLFVSLTSDIVGKKGPINIEVSNNKLAIFIANKGTDQLLHVVAWALLREMLKIQIQKNIDIRAFKKIDMEKLGNIIKDRMEDIRKQLDKIEDIEKYTQQLLPPVLKAIAQIHNSAGQLKQGINNTLFALNREFSREVSELAGDEKPKLPEWKIDKWNELISSADENHLTILEVIRIQLSNFKNTFNLKKGQNETEMLGCLNDDQVCFKITWISSKVRISFAPIKNIDFNEYSNKNVKIEKDNWMTIEGKAKKGDLGDFELELCKELLESISKCNEGN